MARDIDKLNGILRKRSSTPTTGVVKAVNSSTVVVSTSKGPIEAATAGPVTYRKGDRVRLSDGVVIGRVSNSLGLPVYYV